MQWTGKTKPLAAMVLVCGLGGSAAGQASGELSCIDHSARTSANSSQIVATNRCSKPVLANICARIDDRIGTITQGQRIEPGSSYTFDMVNATKARMRYNIAHCEPGQTLRRDLCVPICPEGENEVRQPPEGSERQDPPECKEIESLISEQSAKIRAHNSAARETFSSLAEECQFVRPYFQKSVDLLKQKETLSKRRIQICPSASEDNSKILALRQVISKLQEITNNLSASCSSEGY